MSAYGFTVAPDLAAGPSIDGAFAWKSLLDVCRDLADTAWANGTPIYFDIVPTTPTTYRLQTWTEQRGKDRTVGQASRR